MTGIALIILIGIGGFLYRSVTEQPKGPIACTMDAKICPDGTGLGRSGPSCSFPVCPPPNIDLPIVGIVFALPEGYTPTTLPDPEVIAVYTKNETSGVESSIVIRQFALTASTTAANFIRSNAILDPSGMPASPTAFTSVIIGGHRFSVVTLGRFEGVVSTAYYLSREGEVLRFDALSRNVMNWTDPALDVEKLAANQDLRVLLGTLQGN